MLTFLVTLGNQHQLRGEETMDPSFSSDAIPLDALLAYPDDVGPTPELSVLTRRWRKGSTLELTRPRTGKVCMGDPLYVEAATEIYLSVEQQKPSPETLRLAYMLIDLKGASVVAVGLSYAGYGGNRALDCPLGATTGGELYARLEPGPYLIVAFVQRLRPGHTPETYAVAKKNLEIVPHGSGSAALSRLKELGLAAAPETDWDKEVRNTFARVVLTDHVLDAISLPPGALKKLDLSNARGLSKSSIPWAARQKDLEQLRLDGVPVNASDLEPLFHCRKLKILGLRDVAVSSDEDRKVLEVFRTRGVDLRF